MDLTPDKVSGWYADYTSKRGRWETLAREHRTTVAESLQQPSDGRVGAGIASDNGHGQSTADAALEALMNDDLLGEDVTQSLALELIRKE